jgi:hypothetical protein
LTKHDESVQTILMSTIQEVLQKYAPAMSSDDNSLSRLVETSIVDTSMVESQSNNNDL